MYSGKRDVGLVVVAAVMLRPLILTGQKTPGFKATGLIVDSCSLTLPCFSSTA